MISGQERNIDPSRVHAARVLAGARSGPTAPRIALGAQLRRLREASNITPGQAADAIRATSSKISRLERGRCAVRQRDVSDLLTLYGVTGEAEREELLALARVTATRGWWQQYSDVMPRWLELYIGLERAASVIRSFEVQFVHGLLQTEDYARAVILIANAGGPVEDIDRRVSLRMHRHQLLTQPDPPQLWTVLDEAVLCRSLGGPAVMRRQLEHLQQVADLPNVTVQVLPFRAGPHAASGGPFTILRFPEPDLSDVVYLEQLNSALYLDQAGEVTDYLTVMDKLCVQASNPGSSKDIIRGYLNQI
jgi:transcriptional regulator with XRE-family HTH domain